MSLNLGSWNELKPQYRSLPKIEHIMQTTNTWHACQVCGVSGRGAQRFTYIKHTDGKVSMDKCVACKGRGVLFY